MRVSIDMRMKDNIAYAPGMRQARLFRSLIAVMIAGAALLHGNESASNESAASTVPTTLDSDEVARVLALSEDMEWGAYLAGECATCHGATIGEGAVPVIHGLDASYIVWALLEYRSGIRSNTTMGNVASALDDEEVAVLAHYLEQAVP